jgi:hypothetical protein
MLQTFNLYLKLYKHFRPSSGSNVHAGKHMAEASNFLVVYKSIIVTNNVNILKLRVGVLIQEGGTSHFFFVCRRNIWTSEMCDKHGIRKM